MSVDPCSCSSFMAVDPVRCDVIDWFGALLQHDCRGEGKRGFVLDDLRCDLQDSTPSISLKTFCTTALTQVKRQIKWDFGARAL